MTARSSNTSAICLQDIGKHFDINNQAQQVLAGINLEIASGEFVAIVGPSGCGKSTLLRLLAGLDRHFEGHAWIDGEPPRLPSLHVGLVFQEPRLFPWLSVAANVALGLERLSLSRAEREHRIAAQLSSVGLAENAAALPHQLSGGMAQRVALARALVARPQVLLLDEPFSALDALTKAQMHELLLRLRSEHQLTALMVTHDVEEAVFLADRVVVMAARPGRIQHLSTIDLPHPRLRSAQDFQELRHSLTAQVGLSPSP